MWHSQLHRTRDTGREEWSLIRGGYMVHRSHPVHSAGGKASLPIERCAVHIQAYSHEFLRLPHRYDDKFRRKEPHSQDITGTVCTTSVDA